MATYNSQSGKMSLGPGGSRSARRGRMMGQPDQGGLSTRAASPVGGKKNRGNRSAPSGQLTADDMVKVFQAMPMPNRGFKNPNADKPGKMSQGMAWFDANNSPEQVANRQQRVDTARQKELNGNFVDAATAVDFAKQTKGYTNASGQFVPPTMPSTPSSAYGSGSVSFTDKPTGGTMTDHMGRTVKMSDYLPQQSLVQDSKFGAMPGQENGGALTRPKAPASPPPVPQTDMNTIFPGNGGMPQAPAPIMQGLASSPYSSPYSLPMRSAVNNQGFGILTAEEATDNMLYQALRSAPTAQSLLHSGNTPYATVGSFMSPGAAGTQQLPGPRPIASAAPAPLPAPLVSAPQAGTANWQPDWMNVDQKPQSNPAGTPSWMPDWLNTTQGLTSEQQQAQDTLRGLSNFSVRVGDFWPGNDYSYLQNLFPQVDPAKHRSIRGLPWDTNSLLDAYRNVNH